MHPGEETRLAYRYGNHPVVEFHWKCRPRPMTKKIRDTPSPQGPILYISTPEVASENQTNLRTQSQESWERKKKEYPFRLIYFLCISSPVEGEGRRGKKTPFLKIYSLFLPLSPSFALPPFLSKIASRSLSILSFVICTLLGWTPTGTDCPFTFSLVTRSMWMTYFRR